MKLVLEALDFLELASSNHKLHLEAMRSHIWPFFQVDILSDSFKLVPWNSYTPCFLIESIGSRGVVSQSNTFAIS